MWGKDSLSGNERNRLFINHRGKSFTDVSLLSGADSKADGRSVVLLDYNRDGRLDLATINSNAPKLALYRNEVEEPGNYVAFRFIGANQSSRTKGNSNRDGFGAKVTLKCGTKTFVEEHRCGEGYSAQNSTTLHIGIGDATRIDELTVRWPSGKTQIHQNLPVQKIITLIENQEKPSL